MNSTRRRWLAGGLAGLAGLGLIAGSRRWPDDGWLNPCLGPLPATADLQALAAEAWDGLDPERVWDGHAHVFVHPEAGHLDGARWPRWASAIQARAIANAACVDPAAPDFAAAYLGRLRDWLDAQPAGYKALLLALDAYHDDAGQPRPELSHVVVGNDACARAAASAPRRFEWAASIHPYRADAVAELARVRQAGARAVKWLPSEQNIDPASSRCDAFYVALAASGLPLLTHTGEERAMPGDDELDNPLRLRRALDHGVRVIAAHCATMGASIDLDAGPHGPATDNFMLFERMMGEARYEHLLFGDLSAIPQLARAGDGLKRLLERGAPGGDWSRRLLHGSDHPLPGLWPLYSARVLAGRGLLDPALVEPLTRMRRHNPLLADFVCKRALRWQGKGFAAQVFHTRDFFVPAPGGRA